MAYYQKIDAYKEQFFKSDDFKEICDELPNRLGKKEEENSIGFTISFHVCYNNRGDSYFLNEINFDVLELGLKTKYIKINDEFDPRHVDNELSKFVKDFNYNLGQQVFSHYKKGFFKLKSGYLISGYVLKVNQFGDLTLVDKHKMSENVFVDVYEIEAIIKFEDDTKFDY